MEKEFIMNIGREIKANTDFINEIREEFEDINAYELWTNKIIGIKTNEERLELLFKQIKSFIDNVCITKLNGASADEIRDFIRDRDLLLKRCDINNNRIKSPFEEESEDNDFTLFQSLMNWILQA